MTGGPEPVCTVPAVPFHPAGHPDRPTVVLGTATVASSPGPEPAGLGSLAAGIAATFAAAPGGTVSRETLRDAAPHLGQERWTDGHRARRHQAGGTAGTSRGRRSTSWLRKLLAELERDGIVARDGATVTVLDKPGLDTWAEHWTRPPA